MSLLRAVVLVLIGLFSGLPWDLAHCAEAPQMQTADVQTFIKGWEAALDKKDVSVLASLVAKDFSSDDGKGYAEFLTIINEGVPHGLTFEMSEAGFYRDGGIAAVYPVNLFFADGNRSKLVFFLAKSSDDSVLLSEAQSYRGYFKQPPPGQEITEISFNKTDTGKINTSGFEAEPTVARDGNVLYFQYSPRLFFHFTSRCTGPDREGMTCAQMGNYADPSALKVKGIRTFRTEWDGKRWGIPQVQVPSNLPENTWLLVIIGVSSDEQRALLIVHPEKGDTSDSYLMHRQDDGQWGIAEPLTEINQSGADEDGQFLPELSSGFYFVSDRAGGKGGMDIWLYDRKEKSLKNIGFPVNTARGEWFPKPDAHGNLYFTRDELYVYDGSRVRKLSLGGHTDYPALGASVTADGSMIFYRMRVRPQTGNPDGDWDIYFSRRLGDDPAFWGEPIPVDER